MTSVAFEEQPPSNPVPSHSTMADRGLIVEGKSVAIKKMNLTNVGGGYFDHSHNVTIHKYAASSRSKVRPSNGA